MGQLLRTFFLGGGGILQLGACKCAYVWAWVWVCVSYRGL